ncbi:hypothetical protein SAMN05216452_3410 [Nitratireductor aquibiodomus]|uniref:Swt1-like HEPN domain-containing protein n=1 Tax=Nitratireductor aquibiodomus TaxID=204799 RepID=A0A1H4MNR9_9HYPH|nr:hypothetical protein [Nitratireductor aquibiodomus]SEB84800.1 hypothetical protein SAMN05216452_3410 [Nitratireductor aquibiodomus]
MLRLPTKIMSNEISKKLIEQIDLAHRADISRVRDAAMGISGLTADRLASAALGDIVTRNSVLQDTLKGIYGVGSIHDVISGRMRGSDAFATINDSRWREAVLGTFPSGTAAALAQSLHGQFSLPDTTKISELLSGIDRYPSAMRDAFGGMRELQERLRVMQSPWLDLERESLSIRAFANIQAIGGLATSTNSYSKSITAALRSQLGDWRDPITFDVPKLADAFARIELYDSRGFNPDLTHFSEEAYQETVEVSGLVLDDADVETVDGDDDLELNSRAYQTLLRFEREIRAFIVTVMSTTFGPDWMKHQLPPTIHDQWQAKKTAALKAGADDLPLIEYADFTDYLPIIERKDNWVSVFKPVFGRPEDIRESLQRLYPVRLATMHARIITLDDDLLLRSETTRMFTKLRRHKS